ncbi:MAG: hypothetical protein ACFFBS_08470 [Promethearchaeota archaeon]
MFKRRDKGEQSRFRISRELAKEFETIYDFKEKVSRVQSREAEKISNHFNTSIQIAKAICQLERDGVKGETAHELFQWAQMIREEMRVPVPQVSSYLFNFAVGEGVWIEYLYIKFHSVLEKALMSLANLERAFEKEDTIPAEKIVGIIDARRDVVETLIGPLMDKWKKEHENAPSIYAAQAIVSAALKTPPGRAIHIMEKAKLELQKALFHLDSSLEKESLPEDGVPVKIRVLKLRMHLLSPLSKLEDMALAEVVLNACPRPEAIYVEGEHPSVLVHSPVLRGGLVGPELKTSSDFLERDVFLARRRDESERDAFLLNRVKRAHRTLVLQGNNPVSAAAKLISDMSHRFKASPVDEIEAKRMIIEKAAGAEKFGEFIRKMRIAKSIDEPRKSVISETTSRIPNESLLEETEHTAMVRGVISEEPGIEVEEELAEDLNEEAAEEPAEGVTNLDGKTGEGMEAATSREETVTEGLLEESPRNLDDNAVREVMREISEKDIEKLGLPEEEIVKSLASLIKETFVENNADELENKTDE